MNTRDNFSMNAGIGGAKFGFSTADNNSLTCDSLGNCMLKDNLGWFKKATHTVTKAAEVAAPFVPLLLVDNSLTCDSQGNCMLKDNLATCDSVWNDRNR